MLAQSSKMLLKPLTIIAIKLISVLSFPQDFQEDLKIVGGFEGNKDDYPYVVSLRSSTNDHFCGGTLINYEFVVTAAHCAIGDYAKSVVVGSDSLDEGGTNYKVKSTYIHPAYNETLLRNDIAVLRIEKKAIYKSAFPVRMKSTLSDYGNSCYVMGWGLTSAGGNLSKKFKIAPVQPIDSQTCEKEWKELYNPKVICMSSKRNAACNGDSGGPLVCEQKFTGIVSFGKPCASGKPDVFTAVSSYNEWVDSIIDQ